MRTWHGRNAVYSGDDCIGFRCDECGKIASAMWGETCNECREKERRHRELIKAIECAKKPEIANA